MVEEAEFLQGKTIKWAGIVSNQDSGDHEFVMRFTDGTSATVGAWQREGYNVEMMVEAAAS